jgi:hypothetical protein
LETTLRNNLKKTGKFITNELGKPIETPTLQQVFDKVEDIIGKIAQNPKTKDYMFCIKLPPSKETRLLLELMGDEILKNILICR